MNFEELLEKMIDNMDKEKKNRRRTKLLPEKARMQA
jgi:hypothetical protein